MNFIEAKEKFILECKSTIYEQKVPKAEQDWIYLIHHIHQPEKEEDMEILHHCFLFEKKKLKGKKFSQKHVKDDKIFQHILDVKESELDKVPEIVYDHLDNEFKINIKEINKIRYAVIIGPKDLKNIKWSNQDK